MVIDSKLDAGDGAGLRVRRWLGRAVALVGLAVAASAAQAQADWQLYGVADISAGRFQTSGFLEDERFNSNSLSASFVGLNLKYGFDRGISTGLTLETFLRFQDGRTGRRDSDPGLSRNAFVSVSSPWGLVRVGRLQTSLFDATARFNALGNSIAFSPALRALFLSGNLEGVQGDFYWDKALGYSTPTVEGVTGNLIGAQPEDGFEGHLVGGSLVVARGLLGVALAAQQVDFSDGFSDPTRETTVQLGATYNFGLLRVFGQASQTRDQGLDVRSTSVSTGFSWAVGPGNLIAQVAQTTAKGPAVDRKHLALGGGYVIAYDSVTDVYVLGLEDRVNQQTRGWSAAVGVRYRF